MPTRVLFLTDCNPKVYSGGRYHAFMMAEAAALAGHEVTIWAPAKPLFWRDFVDFPAHERLKLHLNKFETRPGGEFDIVVIIPDGSSEDYMYREGLRIAKKDGARVIFLNFESGNWFNSMSPAPRPIEKWDNWRRTTRFSDMVLSSGEESSRHARGFYIDVQPHIIFADCHPSINSIEADKVWQESIEPEHQVVVVSRFGAASKHKGLDQLLDLISERHSGLTVALLAGTGAMPPEASLRGMQAQFARKGLKLTLLHNISDREKFEHISRSRAVLFPTFFEGFGYPPVEALYMGRPCVTYDLPILREVSGDQLHYAPVGSRDKFRTMLDEVLEKPFSIESANAFRSSIANVARLQNYAGRIDQLFDEVLNLEARPAASSFTEAGFSDPVSDRITLPETLEVEASPLHSLLRGIEVRAFDSVFRARVAFLRSLAESPEHRDRFAMALADNPSLATRLLNIWISRDSTRPAVEAVFQEHFSQPNRLAVTVSESSDPQDAVKFVRNLANGGPALNDFLLQLRSNRWLRQTLLNTALLDLEDGEVASIADYLKQIGAVEDAVADGKNNISASDDAAIDESPEVGPVEALLADPQGLQRFTEFCEADSETGGATINEILGKRALRDQIIESLVSTPPGRSAMARGLDATKLDAAEFSAFMKSLMRTKTRRIELAELIVEKNGDNAALIAALDPKLASEKDIAAILDFAFSSPLGPQEIASREERLDLVLHTLFENLPIATSALEPYLTVGDGLGLGFRAVLSSQDLDGAARLSEAFFDHSLPTESSDLGAFGRWLHDDDQGVLAVQQHILNRPDAAKLLISAAGESILANMLEEISHGEDGDEHLSRLAVQYPGAWQRALEVGAASPSGAKAMASAAAQSYDAAIEVAHQLLDADSGKLALKRILGALFEDSDVVDDLLARPGSRTAVLNSFTESGVASDLFNGMDLRRLGMAVSQLLVAQPELVAKIVEEPDIRRDLVKTVLEEAESDSQLRSWLAAELNQEQIAEHVRSSPLSRELRAAVFEIIDRDAEHAAEYATALLNGPILESNPEVIGRVVSKLPLNGEFGRDIQRAILQHEEFLSDLLSSIPADQLASALGSVTIGALVRTVLREPNDGYGLRRGMVAAIEENEVLTAELAVGSLTRSPRAVFSAMLRGAELSQERVAEAIANVVREEEGVLTRRLRSNLGSGGAQERDSKGNDDGNISIAAWRSAMSSRKVDVAAEVSSLLQDLKWVLPRQFNSLSFQEDALAQCSKPSDVLPLLRRRLTGDSGAIELNGARLHFPETHDLNALIDEVLRRKAYAFETSNSAPFIIDGGANFGIATYAYLAMYPDAQIVAFEPGRRSLASLKENLQENSWANVTVHPFALSSEDGETAFYEPKNMPMGGSITRRLADRNFGCVSYEVKTVKLSDYIDRPVDLLKLDIEGAETAVIEELGEKAALARRIYVEVHSTPDTSAVVRCGQLAERFEALGFQCRSAPNHAVASPFGQIDREHSYVLWARQ